MSRTDGKGKRIVPRRMDKLVHYYGRHYTHSQKGGCSTSRVRPALILDTLNRWPQDFKRRQPSPILALLKDLAIAKSRPADQLLQTPAQICPLVSLF